MDDSNGLIRVPGAGRLKAIARPENDESHLPAAARSADAFLDHRLRGYYSEIRLSSRSLDRLETMIRSSSGV